MKRSVHEVSGHEESLNPKKIKQWSAEDYLVEDTLKLILSKIDLKCQRHARLVCKQWFDIINLSEFNIGALCRDELPSVVSVLSRYNKPISIHFKNLDHINSKDLNHLTLLKNILEFSGYIPEREEFLSALTDLRSLTTNKISTDVFTVLKNLTKLDCKELLGTLVVPVTQLRELRIHESSSLKVSVNNFPHLKRLKADFDGECYLTGLEYLYLRDKYICDSFPITLTELVAERGLSFKDLTTLTRLKTLPVQYSPENNVAAQFPFLERWNAGFLRPDRIFLDRMSQLSYLTSLTVSLTAMPVHDDIMTLTRLLNLTCGFIGNVREIDMSIFSSLSKLTSLRIWGNRTIDVDCKNYDRLTALENLQCLELVYAVTESFLNSMTNLTRLQLITTDTIINDYNHCFTKLTNLVELNLSQSKTRSTRFIDGFSALTHLTSLMMQSIDDDDWRQILKLTNLRSYSEKEYTGSNEDRFADLTVMKHLTYLYVRDGVISQARHLTLLTSLQCLIESGLNISRSLELGELICAKLPYYKISQPGKACFSQNRTIRFVNVNNK